MAEKHSKDSHGPKKDAPADPHDPAGSKTKEEGGDKALASTFKCPACQNVLPATLTCICGWATGSLRCDQCQGWFPSMLPHCSRCYRECESCKRRYLAAEGECPHCDNVKYEVVVFEDRCDATREWELLVFCFRQERSRARQAIQGSVRLVDPMQKVHQPVTVPVEGVVLRAPYSELSREIRVVLAGTKDYGNPGAYTNLKRLHGIPVAYKSGYKPKKKEAR